ncbi:alpha/beta-hydrolase [Conidiobolus coronatus NRRL 28638]|uniref:Alpha/beta-hydrolase n=1 Tax=Conidiobolus coronatus (strain ATCC 28846 / CBS 209.66 / NRRL 28638) TaxID=796925 RepID=A0A137P0V3_CONC2|nr:alpha/beta-hydrolase [Conidiobolus coronatus NRRL 28638]|eukprot:KXN68696.1 alpha/beta-hydrolase [Conidiobolus coronatus NRRL 28638]
MGSKSKEVKLERVEIEKDKFINTLSFNNTKNNGDQKKTLVMTHGFGVGLGIFYKNYDAISEVEGYKTYSIDWLGMGRSSRPPFALRPKCGQSQDEHIAEAEDFFVESLEKWRERQNIEKMTLLGHSLGGYLSTVYALKYPRRVEKLILVSPVGIPKSPYLKGAQSQTELEQLEVINNEGNIDNPLQTINREVRPPLQIPSWIKYLWERNYTPQWIIRLAGPYGPELVGKYVFRRFTHLQDQEQHNLRDYIYHIASMSGSGEYAFGTILSVGAFACKPLISRFNKLTVPTFFIYGDCDWMDHTHALKAQHLIKAKSEVYLVPNAGHQLFLENPGFFNDVLQRILKA